MGGILEQIQAQLDRIEAALRKCTLGDEVDQRQTPFGRRHNAITREQVAKGDPRAWIRGKRHVMTRALVEEVMRSEQRAANDSLPSAVEDSAFYQQTLAEVGNE